MRLCVRRTSSQEAGISTEFRGRRVLRATPELVRRKVGEFWPDRVDQVMSILESCVELMNADDCWKQERARVQLAVIKLSEGSLSELKNCIDMARMDYRDALAYAEFPEQMTRAPAFSKNLSPHDQNELDSIMERDRRQYDAWLVDSRKD